MSTILGEEVAPQEMVARYILDRRDVRSDNTIKPERFIPYRHTKMSVTRHEGLSETQIWQTGDRVAARRSMQLYGRGDAEAANYIALGLKVVPDPLEDNPKHANVEGWPPEKEAQKALAQEIAAFVKYLPKPDS